MPIRDWRLRIDDMLSAIQTIRSYTAGLSLEAFRADRKTVDATVRNIEIIGEAANAVPHEIRKRYAAIPWRDIRSMRNILAHGYFDVDVTIAFMVATTDLNSLETELLALKRSERI
ncbi:MAG: DUF86 domain-containing protein [Alphaproteobacteria bacterium]|nr:DUF86 domain-containing protein [Alphaproteobacteria bacterium]